MDDFEGSYAPQSPDLSGLNNFDDPQPQPAFSNSYYQPQPQPQLPPPQYQPPYHQQYPPQHNPYAFHQQPMPTSNQFQSAQLPNQMMMKQPFDDAEYVPESASAKELAGKKAKKGKVVDEEEVCEKPAPGIEEGVDVKTKFPVARIKRIMQADEDVGKVAQVTPTAVSKALELFMISIVTKSADLARAKSSKRVTAQHLKQALQSDEQFDFLSEIVAKVPDAPTAKKKDDTEDSDEEMEGAKKKKKGPTKRKKKDDDDD